VHVAPPRLAISLFDFAFLASERPFVRLAMWRILLRPTSPPVLTNCSTAESYAKAARGCTTITSLRTI
jgi:hypothetical protein